MSKYHVYGMGNALIDLEFEIHESVLKSLQVEKGTMTLIEEADLHRLLEILQGCKHLKAGGGSAANTMMTLARLGAKTFYSCKVADDAFGDFYHKDLMDSGVITNQDHCTKPKGQTGRCVVLLTPDAERTMCTYLGITADFSKEEYVESELAQAEYLYIEGYLIASESAREAMHLAKKAAKKLGVKTTLSLSDPNMVNFFREEFLALLADPVDILFCNYKEAIDFYQVDTIAKAVKCLKQYAHQFVITEGGHGATLFDGRKLHHLPACPVTVLDTLGAGDAYAGAFLYEIFCCAFSVHYS